MGFVPALYPPVTTGWVQGKAGQQREIRVCTRYIHFLSYKTIYLFKREGLKKPGEHTDGNYPRWNGYNGYRAF